MGFYSLYKILKDMLRTLFGNTFLKIFLVIAIVFTVVFIYSEKTFAYSTSDNLTFTFHNKNYTLPSWIEGHKYACFIETNASNSNYYDILFILFDDNNNEYLTERILNNSYTIIESSGSIGFHAFKTTYVPNLQSVINEQITYNYLIFKWKIL